MKKCRKIVIASVVAVTMLLTTTGAFACSAVYVGKNASTDGTVMIARSEDQGNGGYNKMFVVVPRVENKPGRVMTDINGCKIELPATTYKYTMVPDNDEAEDGTYPGACTNEYGLAVSATVTTYINPKAIKADPEVENGIREATIAGALAASCKTAKEAVETLGMYMKKYGSAEHNIVMITDPNEGWFVELYTGHEWAAVKLPDDMVAMFGNETMIGAIDLDDKENCMHSDNVRKLAEDNKFAVIENGRINLAKSYSDEKDDYCAMRTWMGKRIMAPSQSKDYVREAFEPLFYKPDKKVSVTQVMDILRSRFEGTKFDKNLPENDDRRPMGYEFQSQIHVLQTKKGLPDDMAVLQWLALGNSEHSVFLPYFSNIKDTRGEYKVDHWDYNPNGAYWKFKRLCTLSEQDRERFGEGVRNVWKLTEEMLYSQMQKEEKKLVEMHKKDKAKAADYATSISMDISKDAMDMADVMFDELFVYMMDQTGSVKRNKPANYEGVMVLKRFAEYKGYAVKWNSESKKIELVKGNVKYVLTPNSNEYKKFENGKITDLKMSKSLKIVNGKTFAPYTFVKSI